MSVFCLHLFVYVSLLHCFHLLVCQHLCLSIRLSAHLLVCIWTTVFTLCFCLYMYTFTSSTSSNLSLSLSVYFFSLSASLLTCVCTCAFFLSSPLLLHLFLPCLIPVLTYSMAHLGGRLLFILSYPPAHVPLYMLPMCLFVKGATCHPVVNYRILLQWYPLPFSTSSIPCLHIRPPNPPPTLASAGRHASCFSLLI